MKWILSMLCMFVFTSCAMLGTNLVHSPTATEGTSWKNTHVHGGPTKKAPPDAIIFQIDDSTNVKVGARVIWEKKNFTGILFPIFPIFWLPKTNYYKSEPNSLVIELTTIGSRVNLQVASAKILANGLSYEIESKRTKSFVVTELRFPVPAKHTPDFKLTNLSIVINDTTVVLPPITFRRMKQRWRFVGP